MEKLYSWLEPSLGELLGRRARLPHALLLTGPAGIGKSTLAEVFAASLLCEAPGSDGRACSRCPACGWFREGNHPDFRRLAPAGEDDGEAGATGEGAGAGVPGGAAGGRGAGRAGASSGSAIAAHGPTSAAAGGAGGRRRPRESREIKIGQVRALADFLSIGTHRGGRKIVLVDPADALNAPAANALLKTLEEPPGDSVFLLVSGRPDALPATIRSRCVTVTVPRPSTQAALDWLAADAGVSHEQARAWLTAAGGAPLRARQFAEPAMAAAHRLIVEAVARLPENSTMQVAEAVASAPATAWMPLMMAWVTDLGRVAAGAGAQRFPEQGDRLGRLAKATTVERIAGYGAWLQRQAALAEHPLNARLYCEDVLLRYRALFA
jgi:DNA polymerase-3 subunit delta'